VKPPRGLETVVRQGAVRERAADATPGTCRPVQPNRCADRLNPPPGPGIRDRQLSGRPRRSAGFRRDEQHRNGQQPTHIRPSIAMGAVVRRIRGHRTEPGWQAGLAAEGEHHFL